MRIPPECVIRQGEEVQGHQGGLIIKCQPCQVWFLLDTQVEVSIGQLGAGAEVTEAMAWGSEPAKW